MSVTLNSYCCAVIKDNFGQSLAMVVEELLRHGWQSLGQLCRKLAMPPFKMKRCLVVLAEFDMLHFREYQDRSAEYCCDATAVLRFSRCWRYSFMAKKLHGEYAELLIEQLMLDGRQTVDSLLDSLRRRVADALEGQQQPIVTVADLRQLFFRLVDAHFVRQCATLETPSDDSHSMPKLCENVQPFLIEDVVSDDPPTKKRKLESGNSSSQPASNSSCFDVLWTVNFDKFDQCYLNELLMKSTSIKGNEITAQVLFSLLKASVNGTDVLHSNASLPILASDAWKLVPAELGMSISAYKSNLMALCDDCGGVVTRTDDSSGGIYQIDFCKAVKRLAFATAESIVLERYGNHGLRIFRILKEANFLEQHLLETRAMLPNKDAKELVYNMIAGSVISVKEVAKTTDFAPSRTFYLFHINLHRVVKRMLVQCYQTAFNLISRRHAEALQHKALVEIVQKVEALLAQIQSDDSLAADAKASQLKEVEEGLMPPSSKRALEQHKRRMSHLFQTETQLDSTIFIFETYLAMCK